MQAKAVAFRMFSITRKQVVALTGLLMGLFLIGHLLGNLLIFVGPERFNHYSQTLVSMRPGLYVVEFGLVVILAIHIVAVIQLSRENIQARQGVGARYAVAASKGEPTFAVRTMMISGLLVLVFIITHLLDFTFADHHSDASVIQGKNLELFGLVYNSFYHGWLKAGWYIVAMIVLGFHLDHAIQSACQTFGLNHPRYTPKIKLFSRVFAIVIALGFASIPLYVKLVNPMGAG